MTSLEATAPPPSPPADEAATPEPEVKTYTPRAVAYKHPDEGKIVGDKVCINGEWCPANRLMDFMINRGPEIGEAFSKMSKKDQADILMGRRTFVMQVPKKKPPPLPKDCPNREWYGKGDGACDGCGAMRHKIDPSAPSMDLRTCPRCRYACCEHCREDEFDRHCWCKDSNFGVPYEAGEATRGFW
mmetsp:Transcript_507/g.1469  ORF Transcript_507/g.1469 Transcript_507/m.1469 type:complete len:186 (+) Transcript_507:239-796(+)